jgi:hypothetical protein
MCLHAQLKEGSYRMIGMRVSHGLICNRSDWLTFASSFPLYYYTLASSPTASFTTNRKFCVRHTFQQVV